MLTPENGKTAAATAVSDYEADRRLFAVMRLGGWEHDGSTGGFVKWVRRGVLPPERMWVAWAQAEDALRLADAGEPVQGVAPLSESVARVVAAAGDDP